MGNVLKRVGADACGSNNLFKPRACFVIASLKQLAAVLVTPQRD